ncbi:MAG: YkgJ family cysteine cluster protein [Deltaproteobacteria bacterium]|nr:YkgJ family cysteine cluster protein [Deltaproteobacteria bacterium]
MKDQFMFDYQSIFEQYEALVRKVDQAVGRVHADFPAEVRCRPGCSDCCFAVFDLTLVEAFYLNAHFHWELPEGIREKVIGRAEIADRQFYQIKHRLQRLRQREQKTDQDLLLYLAEQRVRCPLLNDADHCDFYAFRPLTCRIYGIPAAIQGAPRICGRAGFQPGLRYPTVNLDQVNGALFDLSRRLLETAGVEDPDQKLRGMVVPVSEALLTDFDEEFFRLLAKRSLQDAVATD